MLSGITGNVRDRAGRPAVGAHVYAYRHARGGLRGPADFVAEVEPDGDYLLDLAPGSYYLIARARAATDSGPPRPGEASAVYPHNPVLVTVGKLSQADFHLQTTALPLGMKGGALPDGDTGFTGRLVDASGTAVAGAFVLAYRDGDLQRMPDATSSPVGADGIFILHLPVSGRWCLAARTGSRGMPGRGELYGVLAEGTGECRNVRSGEMQSVGAIVLRPRR